MSFTPTLPDRTVNFSGAENAFGLGFIKKNVYNLQLVLLFKSFGIYSLFHFYAHRTQGE